MRCGCCGGQMTHYGTNAIPPTRGLLFGAYGHSEVCPMNKLGYFPDIDRVDVFTDLRKQRMLREEMGMS